MQLVHHESTRLEVLEAVGRQARATRLGALAHGLVAENLRLGDQRKMVERQMKAAPHLPQDQVDDRAPVDLQRALGEHVVDGRAAMNPRR